MRILDRLSVIDIFTIIFYIAAMIGLGALAGRKVKNAQDFSTAGQRLSWPLAAGSTIATCMGANMVIGKYDLIDQGGMAGLTTSLFWWVGWILLLCMTRPLRASGVSSIPAFLAKRYNDKTQKISSYCVLVMTVSSCAAQFLSIGAILEALGVCDRSLGVWVGAALIVLFTIFSGLWGVALTDSIQSVILMVSFGIVFPVAVIKSAGGWDAITAFNQALSPERMDMFSGIAPISMVGWALYYTLSTGSDPALSQRIFAARDTKSALLGQGVAWGFTLAICGFLSAVPGLAIRMIFPDIAHGSSFAPLFIASYMPPVVKGLMLAALLGLMLTSGDTYLLLLSSTAADDILRRRQPDMEGKKLLRCSRLICVLSALLICAMALYVDSIFQLFKTGAGAYGAGVFFPLLLGCFWKRAKTKAINAGMLAGTATAFCFDMFLKIPLHWDVDGVLVGAAICLAVCVCGSLLTNGKDPERGEGDRQRS